MKKCNQCKEVKTSKMFHRDASAWDGLQRRCKTCRASDSPRTDYMRRYVRSRVARDPEFKARRAAFNSARRDAAPTTPETLEYYLVLRGDPCSYCGATMQHVDHVVPIAAGGSSTFRNLTAACAACNQSKTDETLLHFMLRRAA